MALELLKDVLTTRKLVMKGKYRYIIENDIIVPDSKPDVADALIVDGDCLIEGAEAKNGKIIISGVVRYKVLYSPDGEDKKIRSINTDASFTYEFAAEVQDGIDCIVEGGVEHIEYEISNSRKLGIKTILIFDLRAYQKKENFLIKDLTGLTDIQSLRSSIKVDGYIGRCREIIEVAQGSDIPQGKPAIGEILRSDVSLKNVVWNPSNSRFTVKGDVNIFVLYTADDEERSIQSIELEIPFNKMADIQGIDENSLLDTGIRVMDYSVDMDEDIDGEKRVLDARVDIEFEADAFGDRAYDIIEDAYSTGTVIDIQEELLSLEEVRQLSNTRITHKESLSTGDEEDIAEIYNILCKAFLSEYETNDGAFLIDGILRYDIIYLSNETEKPIKCIRKETAFRESIKVDGLKAGQDCQANLGVFDCSYSIITASEVEIRTILDVNIKALKEKTLKIIEDVEELPNDKRNTINMPSLLIHFAQNGESIWNVAKKYRTSLEEIEKVNGYDRGSCLKDGQQIIIMKKA